MFLFQNCYKGGLQQTGMKKDSLLYNYDEKRHYYRNFSMLSTEWEIMHLSENVIFYVIIITWCLSNVNPVGRMYLTYREGCVIMKKNPDRRGY